jgi:hypothetical protein
VDAPAAGDNGDAGAEVVVDEMRHAVEAHVLPSTLWQWKSNTMKER